MNYSFTRYLIKFVLIFCILYYGTIGIIGIAAPGNYFSPVIKQYFDYVAWLRASLLYGSKLLVSWLGYNAIVSDIYSLKIENGRGVHIGYDCIGYGVMSFWAAFVIANKGTFLKKCKWVFGGILLVWCINVARICLLLLAINKHWPMPFGLDHHTLFNIAAYSCIFIMIYLFDRADKTVRDRNE